MASYDKNWLLGFLERRRAHNVAGRDLAQRLQDARDDVNRLRNSARAAARGHRLAEEAVERFVSMPLDQANALAPEETAKFIFVGTWQDLLVARARLERLERDQVAHREYGDEHFALAYDLLQAVRKWGFRTTELEVI